MFYTGRKSKLTGSALIETALLLPVLILIILGTFELGWALFVQNTMQDAAREGARIASTQNTGLATITSSVTDSLTASNVSIASAVVNVNPATVNIQPRGTPITVSVSIPYSQISILPTPLFLGTTTLTAQVTMVKEY